MTAPFVSLADLQDLVGEDVSGSDLAVMALDSACEMVRTFLDNPLNLVTDDEIALHGTGTEGLLLPDPPVLSVDTVTEDDIELTADDWLLADGILYRVGGCWSKGRANIEIVYTHGYAATEADLADGIDRMPSDIRMVALDVARRLYAGVVVDGSSQAPRDDIGGTPAWAPFTVPRKMLDDEKERLMPYRVPKVG